MFARGWRPHGPTTQSPRPGRDWLAPAAGFEQREAPLSPPAFSDPTPAAPGQPAPADPVDNGFVASFNEYLLGGVVGLTIFAIVLTVSLYIWPGRYLQIPEMEAVVRVAEEASFPVGESRVVTLGPDVVLVVRSGAEEYHALQGTSSLEGCILEWDPASLRVVSPCKFLVYDLHGNVVRGLTTVPLHQYTVFVRQGTVYVTGS